MNLALIFNHEFLLFVFLGSILGLLVGILPGLSAVTGVSILVVFSYTMSVYNALAMIMGIYVLSCFAGAITAILINIPGTPSAIMTTLDGYKLAKKGHSKRAILTSCVYSSIGSIFGFIVLGLLAYPMSKIALNFRPLDYFLLCFIGLMTVSSLSSSSSKSKVRGSISALAGILLSLVGVDTMTGALRFTHNDSIFINGIQIIPALIGLFGFSEVIKMFVSLRENNINNNSENIKPIKERVNIFTILKHYPLAIRSSIIGVLVGALPGAGSPIASLLAYNSAKKTVKNNRVPFGDGAIEGVVASESANNALVGGALIPLLTLGIPGDAVTSIILSVFYIHGLTPGPFLFTQSSELFDVIVIAGLLSSIMILILGFIVSPVVSKIVHVKKNIMIVVVSVICVVGAYSNATNISDIAIMLMFALLGFLMNIFNYSPYALVLGLVLGKLMDSNLRRSIALVQNEENIFLMLKNMIIHPITIVLILIIFSIFFKFVRKKDNR